MKRLGLGCVALGFALMANASWAMDKVTVFAASSLTNAMNDVAQAYQAKTGEKPTLSYASSAALARQIAQGAPADIYLSANEKWMDYLVSQGAIETSSRKTLLENHLVMVAPTSYPTNHIALSASWDMKAALEGTRLAVGDPQHVPAGIYTKEAFTDLGLWQQAEPLLARANNVRGALLLVERQEAMLGVVYKTDAMISDKVKVVSEIPDDSHSPIAYSLAIVKGKTTPAVQGFYDYLLSDEAAAIFAQYGFGERK
ncbi:molybdate ABC transporter substrate-binding protein [Photobacterium aphoticum]|uniref:Molybdenum ABC transporter substrate-binding protein n=1 Tax=Photobacterium aphoticum TaxID=754436 RepID=A0A0J1GQZ5_9GAMM|nr:molybdate ABC transporter substrate-binding protein [Photobacterium aphoticum]KLV01834.1 molybdenum ABC transporter substrate-binding protein [Photobacterium aphoticum]PSU60063.1 molybdate ABC transporter substrate-binding protein [Photobacterium aphoticum]GHA32887.1 molybdate ABC transporter substrate-binding protein [Photobacterium aphoticum]